MMTKEAFEQELLSRLEAERLRRPAMRREDEIKFVFQAMLGVGHLLSSREAVTAFIARETGGLQAAPEEPLLEPLSPAWCRLNLRRALADGLRPEAVAGMMLDSACTLPFTRQDVQDVCRRWLERERPLSADDEAALAMILDETWLPSHSPAYRKAYHPAYRVVSAAWIAREEAVRRIARGLAGGGRLLVTLDGPCASGKTTLADALARAFGGEVIHTDEYVIPHAQKTRERLAVPGGNCDAERLVREVVAPFRRGDPVRYRRYNFREDRMMPAEQLPETRFLILEGSYCNLPEIRAYADVRLFLEASWETRMERLSARETPAALQMFLDRWIPLENAYFEAYHLPDDGCRVIRQ